MVIHNDCFGHLHRQQCMQYAPCPIMNYVSMVCQRCLVLHFRQSQWGLIAHVYKLGIGSLYRQIRLRYSRDILQDSNNFFHFHSYH